MERLVICFKMPRSFFCACYNTRDTSTDILSSFLKVVIGFIVIYFATIITIHRTMNNLSFKSCSQFIYIYSSFFSFSLEGGMWDLIMRS